MLDLLEYYSLEICKGASFGLLQIYLETFGPFVKSPRRENYFKNVCNLYRLPGDYVRCLLSESTLGYPRRFSASKLQTKVIKQVSTDWYDRSFFLGRVTKIDAVLVFIGSCLGNANNFLCVHKYNTDLEWICEACKFAAFWLL